MQFTDDGKPIFMRWFQVDLERMNSELKERLHNLPAAPSEQTPAESPPPIRWKETVAEASSPPWLAALKQLLKEAGILDLSPPRSAFFYERIGMLVVRATAEELDLIEQIMNVLQARQQVMLEIKWCERKADDAWPEGLTPPADDTNAVHSAILTETQKVLDSLQQQAGVDLLAAPRVTTLSGRHVQIKLGSTNDAGLSSPASKPHEPEPVLTIIPRVETDGVTVTLMVVGTIKEFVGYDLDQLRRIDLGPSPPRKSVVESALDGDKPGAARGATINPLPASPTTVFRQHQIYSTAAVFDGQTLVLVGGLSESEVRKDKVLGDLPVAGRPFRSERRETAKKALMLFITPTLIDPAGNRIHTAEELAEKIGGNEPKP